MDLRMMINAVFKHKLLVVLALLLGLAMAGLSVYEVGLTEQGRLRFEPRTYTTYRSSKLIIIDQPGFALGRSANGSVNLYQYQRTVELTGAYKQLITSADVLSQVKRRLGNLGDVVVAAKPVDNSPVIRITATSSDPVLVRRVTEVTAAAFTAYLRATQRRNDIPRQERIEVKSLGRATLPEAQESRRTVIVFLSFLIPVASVVLAAAVLENLRLQREQGSAV